MLRLCRVTKVKVLFLVLVYVFNFNLVKFSAAILEKGLFSLLLLQGTDLKNIEESLNVNTANSRSADIFLLLTSR